MILGLSNAIGDSYVQVRQGRLELDALPYRYIGVNYWQAPLLGLKAGPGDRERLCRELDRLCELGLSNLRFVALSERAPACRMEIVAQESPGVFNETWFEGLDFVLAEMDKRKMKAVVCLTNYWDWSGGFSQYNAWAGGPQCSAEPLDWDATNVQLTAFYGNPKAQLLLRQAVEHLVYRRNIINGRPYSADPTIMAWQLCNEARPGNDKHTATMRAPMLAWLRSAAAHLKGLGVRQLLSTGCEGVFGCNGDEELYTSLSSLPEIDYLTAHLWPQNWGWFSSKNAAETYPATEQRSTEFISQHVRIAKALGKPLVLEEFGLPRDNGGYTAEAGTAYRNRFLRLLGDAWQKSSAEAGPLQGLNIWTWSGETTPADNQGKPWAPGLPIIGDQPGEPQGWYSVLPSDRQTIEILSGLANSVGMRPQAPF